MSREDANAPIEADRRRSTSESASQSFKGVLMRMVRRGMKDKSEVDKQFDSSVRALEAWKKECEAKIALKEDEIRNRYDSIDVSQLGEAQSAQMELKRKQQEAEDLAFEEEIERELGSSV